MAAHRASRLEQADTHYRRVLGECPDNARALHPHGDLTLAQGRFEDAEGEPSHDREAKAPSMARVA